MERTKQAGKKKGKERDKGKETEQSRKFIRSENIFDNSMDDLMDDLSSDISNENEILEENNETPVDNFEDEDFEEDKISSYNEILFESEAFASKTKRAFLAVVQMGDERTTILQNLKFPRFQNQKPDLETKAKILKYLGDYIIKDGRLLIDIACSGKDLLQEGTLGQKKLIKDLIQNKNLKKKNNRCFTEKTLGEYISKIRRFENIQLPNGKTYSMTQFLGGPGKVPDTDQVEFLKFLVGRMKKSNTNLAREYINNKRIISTSEAEKKIEDKYRSRFKNLKLYLKNHKRIIPNDWTPEESAEFYLSKSNLPCEKDLIETVSKLLKTNI